MARNEMDTPGADQIGVGIEARVTDPQSPMVGEKGGDWRRAVNTVAIDVASFFYSSVACVSVHGSVPSRSVDAL
ncbi:hypothetical protein OPV22_011315 [Ensete ventricosum]|uniref:Uncharacterized protein n=1 Tax=Ensete ventricosum TaxID=4639 RepID=A0AAV8RK83_ENSVE|nr:hypothetical protein OPV22_011315 [Ensete ventricosum]